MSGEPTSMKRIHPFEIPGDQVEMVLAILDPRMPIAAEMAAHVSRAFDTAHDQETRCTCGHTYIRHFDWMAEDRPGCKYCECDTFVAILSTRHMTSPSGDNR